MERHSGERHRGSEAFLGQAVRFLDERITAKNLLVFALFMLALHWVQPWADRDIHFGFLSGQNWATDLCTDEGWEANAATRAVLLGTWYSPKEMNLAVEAPAWPAIVYLPFRYVGVSVAVDRTISTTLFILSVLALYFFVRRLSDARVAAFTIALLSANALGFTFGRVAFVEPVFVCFGIVALLFTLYAADSDSPLFMILAGIALCLAVLVKLTAVFMIVPMLAVIWLRAPSSRARIRLIAITIAMVLGVFFCRHLLVKPYPEDAQLYTQMNLVARQVRSLKQWVIALARIAAGLRVAGVFLIGAFVVGMALILSGRRRSDQLMLISLSWLAANVLIFSSLNYFPPRYCFSLLFPITILAVRAVSLLDTERVMGRAALYGLLGLALITSTAHDLISLAHPHYTMLNFAKRIQASLPESAKAECPIVGSFSNTLSLYTKFPSLSEGAGWSTQPLYERIESCSPRFFVSNPGAELDADTTDSFDRLGKKLELREQTRLFGYAKPVSLYSVKDK